MADINLDRQHNLAILKALDEAIEQAPWDTTIFLQAMRNRLIEIRDKFKHEALLDENTDENNLVPATLFGRIAKRTGIAEVFVLIYSADGINIHKWENILRSISKHTISRPIYRSEQDAKKALRAASNKLNEAYVSVFIHEDDIIPPKPDKIPHDRYGTEILNIKEGIIHLENIHHFVHASGVYEFRKDMLVRLGTAEFI